MNGRPTGRENHYYDETNRNGRRAKKSASEKRTYDNLNDEFDDLLKDAELKKKIEEEKRKAQEKNKKDYYEYQEHTNTSSNTANAGYSNNGYNQEKANQKSPFNNRMERIKRNTEKTVKNVSDVIRGVETLDSSTKNRVSKNLNQITGKIRSGVMTPIKQIEGELESSFSNGTPTSKKYRYVKNLGNIGSALVVGIAIHAENQHALDKIKTIQTQSEKGSGVQTFGKDKEHILNIKDVKDAQHILYKNKITISRSLKLRNYNDVKRLQTQINVLSSKSGYGNIIGRSDQQLLQLGKTIDSDIKDLTEELNSLQSKVLIPKDKKGNPLSEEKINKRIIEIKKMINMKQGTKDLLSVSAQFRDTSKNGINLKTNKKQIIGSIKRAVLEPIRETETYRGYQILTQTYHATKAVIKAQMAETKCVYRILKNPIKKVGKGVGFGLKKVGVAGATHIGRVIGEKNLTTIANMTKSSSIAEKGRNITNATTGVAKKAGNIISATEKQLSNLKVMKRNGTSILRDRVVHITKTKPVRSVARWTSKTPVGRPFRHGNLVVKKTLNKIKRTKVGKLAGSALKTPFKITNTLIRGISSLIKTVSGLLAKILMGVVIGNLVIIVIFSSFMLLVTFITSIIDAISNKYENFVTNTTMGATYEKLLDKEAQFIAALRTTDATVEIPQEFTDMYGISQYTDIKLNTIDGSGAPATNTSTIKGILSMAAIYIDQNFTKYGSALDGVFADSVYKDYCAKLYDSTHIIGVAAPNMDGSDIYYCSEPISDGSNDTTGDNFSSEQTRNPAMENCNNKGVGSKIENDYPRDEDDYEEKSRELIEQYKKEASAVAICRQKFKDGSYKYNPYYEVVQKGPHGSLGPISTSNENAESRKAEKEALMESRGCTNYEWIVTMKIVRENAPSSESSMLVCTCPKCNGHVDAKTYAFISNIYDPGLNLSGDENYDPYSHLNNESPEMKYSMYALDKYATAFDEPVSFPYSTYCNNPDCDHYWDGISGPPPERIEITENNRKCPSCGTTIMGNNNSFGDQESVNEAEGKNIYDAEKHILDTITGEDNTIVEWWNNDGWFENLVTKKTYTRLLSDGDIEKANEERTESGNVVNKNNSDAYWFNCFSAPSGRNHSFTNHGWDKNSIERVRLLMAGDWEELYGVTNFGGINIVSGFGGGGMTQAQIEQLMANNTEWKDLCDDRKALMYTCTKFYSEIQRLNVHYHGAGCSAPSLDALAASTSDRQYFGIGGGRICPKEGYPCSTQPGVDCSGFVSWIVASTFPGEMNRRETTVTMGNLVGTKLLPVTDGLKPGDIALKPGSHVLMYIGNGQWAEAAGHKPGIVFGSTHSNQYWNGYGFYRLSCIDEDKFSDVDNTEDTENENSELLE